MPEGDTLHRIAARIRPAVEGRRVASLSLSDLGPVEEARDWTVQRAHAVGKHLLVEFDAPWTLRAHLGMNGRVRVVPARESRPGRSTFALTVAGEPPITVVCSRAYRAELIRTGALKSHARLARLGPDLLDPDVDPAGVADRARHPSFGHREIADVLLDQRVAAGIGNVYKSEVLFLRRIHPRTRMALLTLDEIQGLYEEAIRQMRRNLKTRFRTTVPTRRRPTPASPRLFVYERAGKPCLDCGTPIARMVQGDMARSTYWCPECQVKATA